MGKYQPYPEYKDSGISWLGHIPIEWELRRAKFIFQRIQRVVRDNDNIVTAFRDGQVTLRLNRRTDGFTNALQEIGYQGVRKGDLLIHAMDGFAGAIGISDSDGKCSPVCSVCIPRTGLHIEPQYYGYLIRQLAVTGYITSLAKGIRERSTEFRYSEFSPLELALPTIHEQRTIASFLDYETARIDQLIAKQQQLIELLKEKRQAVISHAVTKGLNPNAPMKDSSVEWLGKVPEHWDVMKVGHAFNIANNLRTPIDRNIRAEQPGEYPYYGPTGILDYINECSVHGEYFLLGEDGDHFLKFSEKAMTILVSGDFSVNNHAHLLQGQDFCLTAWGAAYFETKDITPWLIRQGVGRYKLRKESLVSIPILVPPLDEQYKIVGWVGQIKNDINMAIERSQSLIRLLQERRTALISAAVTGKIDLRGWQPPKSEVAA